jgi:hypothetical protein
MQTKKLSLPPPLPTNRKFGWFFATVFSALGAYAFWKAWTEVAAAALALSVLFAAVTLVAPQLLSPLNRLWYGLGLLLGKIVSPIVLGIIFFILITPISLITRLFGRDELKIKKRSVDTYWVDRSPPGPSSDSFKNQY